MARMREQSEPIRTEGTPRVSAVVPCFDEEAALPELYERLTAACRDLVGKSYEIVLVNDGSRDRTWDVIKRLCDSDTSIVGVNLSRNHGHQLALTAGLSICRGDRILILDADLQDPPELLPEMSRLMDSGAEVVYGKRTQRSGESWFKRFTASLFYRLVSRLTDVGIPTVGLCGWRQDEGLGFLGPIVVLPQKRKWGVGGLMLAHAVDALRAEGVRSVESAFPLGDPACGRLFGGFGFREVGNEEGEDGVEWARVERILKKT